MGRPRKPYFRNSDGWWVSRFDGKYVKLAKGRAAKSAALKRFHEFMALELSRPVAEPGRLTVAAIIELYLQHMKPRYAVRSIYERKLVLQSFAETHGWRLVNDSDCLPVHLTSWLDSRTEWKSDWTKAHAVAVVHAPFNWAARGRLITANPFRGVTHRAGMGRRPMTDEEFARLIGAARGRQTKKQPTPGARFIEFLQFLRLTGARPGEASKLLWEQVDREASVITLSVHKTSRTQRTPKPRIIVLTPEVCDLIAQIRSRQESGTRVFNTHCGTPWTRSNLSLRMQRAKQKAGLASDLKLYGLRHRYGTVAIVSGVDIKTLAELMGHTTTRMTEHYVSLAGQRAHLLSAAQKISHPELPPVSATPPEDGRSSRP